MSYDWSRHTPGPHEIETWSGRYVDLSDPRPGSITLDDVAHGLSNTCRYNGQVTYYSVAEHAVMVSRRLERQGRNAYVQLMGLHHDDAEAFLGDITRPLKSLLQPVYGDLTEMMDDAIMAALRLPCTRFDTESVKAADNWALFIEAEHLLPSKGRSWGGSGAAWEIGEDHDRETDVDLWTGGQDPWTACQQWLAQHAMLLEQVDDIEDAQRAIREYA